MKKGLKAHSSLEIEKEIRSLVQQISYDVKEYTVEVLVHKFNKKEI